MVQTFTAFSMVGITIYNRVEPRVSGLGEQLAAIDRNADVFKTMSHGTIKYHMSELFIDYIPLCILNTGLQMSSTFTNNEQYQKNLDTIQDMNGVIGLVPHHSNAVGHDHLDAWNDVLVNQLKDLLLFQSEDIDRSEDPNIEVLDALSRIATGYAIHDLLAAIENGFPVQMALVEELDMDARDYYYLIHMIQRLEDRQEKIKKQAGVFKSNVP